MDAKPTAVKHIFGGNRRFRKKTEVGLIEKPPMENLRRNVTEEMLQVQKKAAEQRGEREEDVTFRYELEESGLEPVTGWLVCVSGKEKGKDYRIEAGFNYVGRGRKMDVVLSDDLSVARERHCAIVYDKKSNETFLTPGKGAETYYKKKLVTKPVKIYSGDEIELGETKYIFISFCEGGRSWEK
ncbi:MAG: FHA domain-containing protein [Eubacteriales bacterium]|nr:FHA domain-containing protein [Eubacteriales bacterium]